MRVLLDGSGASPVPAGGMPNLPIHESGGDPKWSLQISLLVLLGIGVFIGLSWIVFRVFQCYKHSEIYQPNAPPSGSLAQVPLRRAPSQLSGARNQQEQDIESLSVTGRSDSMVTRASAWARAILAGPPVAAPRMSLNSKRTNLSPVVIPVKQAIVVMQPDGEPYLGISEATQKDVMVQVDERDLFVHGSGGCTVFSSPHRATTSSSRTNREPRSSQTSLGQRSTVDAALQATPSRAGSGTELSSLGGSAEITARGNDDETIGALSSSSPAPTTQDAVTSFAEVSPGEERRRRRRRRRRRGMTDASCQTTE